MEIDYGKIIETAEARRAALEQLTDLVNAAPAELTAMHHLLAYYTALRNCWNRLDEEGRKLLPPGLRSAIPYAGPQAIENLLFHPNYGAPNGLSEIARHAKPLPPVADDGNDND